MFAVVSEVVEQPRGRKSKIVGRVRLQDESMVVSGALADSFRCCTSVYTAILTSTTRFDILAHSMEQIPELEPGCVLRCAGGPVCRLPGVV